jgi:nucleoside-diphosphate-sugar epimerase
VPRYLVTGATGFVGAEVAKQLMSRGHKVVALVRTPAKASLLALLGAELHTGDITEPDTLVRPMQGVDGVFHLAAWYKVGAANARALAEAVNVEGTRHVLDAMRTAGVPKGVHTSSLAVNSDTHGTLVDESFRYDGPHLSVYDETKWRAHYEVAVPAIETGLPLVIVQPGVVYGPGDTSAMHDVFVRHLRRRLPFVPGRTAYCWGHVDDIAHAHIEAMDRGRVGESYIIAGPVHTLLDAVRIAASCSGRRAPLAAVPPAFMRLLARAAQAVESRVSLPPGASAEMLRVAAGVTYLGSPDKAARELGFAPRPLLEGLRHTIEHEMRALGLPPRE